MKVFITVFFFIVGLFPLHYHPHALDKIRSGEIDYYTGVGSTTRTFIQGMLSGRVSVCYRPAPHQFSIVSSGTEAERELGIKAQ